MKRSEMLQIISKNLQKHENIFNGYKNSSINLKCASDNLASYILKEIEEAGMTPPLSVFDCGIDNTGNRIQYINEWEPEE